MAFNQPTANVSSGSFQYLDTAEDKVATEFVAPDIFVTGHTRYILENIIDISLSSVVTYLGIVNNILILVVFFRQGYEDSTNISMSAIAIWDFIKCLAGAITRLYAPIGLVSQADSMSWANISTATLVYLVTFSNYVSSALAAYVAVERCLCVTMPFKVKAILTPRTTLVFMVGLSAVVFGSFFPIFFIYDIHWVQSPSLNTTIAVYTYSTFFHRYNGPLMRYYNLIGVIYPAASFFIIIISTGFIISRLKVASNFRSENASNASHTKSAEVGLTSRDKQVIKMLLVIIAVYVIALFPRIVLYLAKFYEPEFYFLKKFHNIFWVVCYFIFFLDFGNATVNLYIFLAMSSNFRATFKGIFCPKATSKTSRP